MEITKKQKSDMCHALGFRDGDKFNMTKSYRNYFYTSTDDKDWCELVEKGLATSRPSTFTKGESYFHVSDKGIEVLSKR